VGITWMVPRQQRRQRQRHHGLIRVRLHRHEWLMICTYGLALRCSYYCRHNRYGGS
jgi:hypothetical protein